MRPDMGRVIVEVGRSGSGSTKTCYDKIRRPGEDFENLPSFESMSRHRKQDGNSQGDRLNPLRRFLAANVGRPWSKVFSEICAVNDKRNIRGYHLLTHLEQYVDFEGAVKRSIASYDYTDFKVGPDGILRKHDWRKSRWWYRETIPAKPVTKIKLEDGWEYRKIENLWYKVHFRTDERVIPGHFTERTYSYGKKAEWKYRYWVNTRVIKNEVMDAKFSCGRKELKEVAERIKDAGR